MYSLILLSAKSAQSELLLTYFLIAAASVTHLVADVDVDASIKKHSCDLLAAQRRRNVQSCITVLLP